MFRHRVTSSIAAAALVLGSAGIAQAQQEMAAEGPSMNIVETAVAAGQFNTLAAALKAAGLVETLQSDGPFTVFAPTDAAFAKLPAGTVETLLKPENKDQLVAILTYHVISGEYMASDVVGMDAATTVQGDDVSFSVSDDGAMVNDANIVKTDIAATNGVIHVIDSVILPPQD